jgi:hypothetical protein
VERSSIKIGDVDHEEESDYEEKVVGKDLKEESDDEEQIDEIDIKPEKKLEHVFSSLFFEENFNDGNENLLNLVLSEVCRQIGYFNKTLHHKHCR